MHELDQDVIDIRVMARHLKTIGHNILILRELERLAEYKKRLLKTDASQAFKLKAINNAIVAIGSLPENVQITSGKMAMKIKGVGKNIATRIDEILETGKLSEITERPLSKDDFVSVLDNLTSVEGIGEQTAKKLYTEGYRSVSELKSAVSAGTLKTKLTDHMLVGLKYYDDLQQRIPREEIDQIFMKFKRLVHNHVDRGLIIEICGSYRRKLETSGDIDVLITAKSEDLLRINSLAKIVEVLTRHGLLVANFTDKGALKYMGVCKLNQSSPARHIDIRIVEYPKYYYGLLYFTGSKDFNVIMRTVAQSKGMKLSEYGLTSVADNESWPANSEKDIFKWLGVKYLPPEERNLAL